MNEETITITLNDKLPKEVIIPYSDILAFVGFAKGLELEATKDKLI